MVETLYKHLEPRAPSFATLHKEYDPILQLIKLLIGTVPNCVLVLEMFPVAFKSYNLLIGNLLNMPFSLFGNPNKKRLMGLALYTSSSSSGCNYCTAHTCSFALRRGLDESVILGNANEKEKAIIKFAKNISAVPCTLTDDDLKNLQKHCSESETEAVAMSVVMLGYLNKFMDVLGVELEQDSINDVSQLLKKTNWKTGKHLQGEGEISPDRKPLKVDNLSFYLNILRNGPGQMKLEKAWLKGAPKSNKKIDEYLIEKISYDFPLFNKAKRLKLKRVFAKTFFDNFDNDNTDIGLRIKIIGGLLFALVVNNQNLENILLTLAEKNSLGDKNLLQKMANEILQSDDNVFNKFSFSTQEEIVLRFAKAGSYSPSVLGDKLLMDIKTSLSDVAIVEMASWLSLLQVYHRFEKLSFIYSYEHLKK